jgi:hypothetical protein
VHVQLEARGIGLPVEYQPAVTWRGGLGELRSIQAAIGMGLDAITRAGLDLTQFRLSV